jgi:hypothetical protein
MNGKNAVVLMISKSGFHPDTLAYYRKVMQDPESLTY